MNEIKLEKLSLEESPISYPYCETLAILFYIKGKTCKWYQNAIQFLARQPEILCVTASCSETPYRNLQGLIVTRNELNKNQLNFLLGFVNTRIFSCITCPFHFKKKYEMINKGDPNLIFDNGVMPTFKSFKQCFCDECETKNDKIY